MAKSIDKKIAERLEKIKRIKRIKGTFPALDSVAMEKIHKYQREISYLETEDYYKDHKLSPKLLAKIKRFWFKPEEKREFNQHICSNCDSIFISESLFGRSSIEKWRNCPDCEKKFESRLLDE